MQCVSLLVELADPHYEVLGDARVLEAAFDVRDDEIPVGVVEPTLLVELLQESSHLRLKEHELVQPSPELSISATSIILYEDQDALDDLKYQFEPALFVRDAVLREVRDRL